MPDNFSTNTVSWPNWIECGFTLLHYFTRDGRDHLTHTTQQPQIVG
ncbi:hypothetical protein [Amycolatopsis sp. H20-H5]|nr:hypothetical protein [Amycolatopsis sp. H20-H5]MEC3974483.1 hypothetical protein [Amycolatopsis sp. H20-H5]